MKRAIRLLPLAVASLLVVAASRAAEPPAVYASTCAACHATGVANAPKLGDAAEWQRRLQRGGQAALIEAALKGRGAMPPKGGNAALSDAEVRATVLFMLGQSVRAAGAAGAPAKPDPARAPAPTARGAANHPGQATYALACAPCHRTGVLGSPRLDDAAAWAPRLAAGAAALYANAINGKGTMPPKGANPNLSDDDVRAAVDYMLAQLQPRASVAASAPKPAAAPAAAKAATPADAGKGAGVYRASCSACHAAGVAGAPKVGDAAAWAARIQAGANALYASALKGKGAMPAKGGNAALADADVRAAVDFMIAQSRGAAAAATEGKPAAPPVAPTTAQAPAAQPAPAAAVSAAAPAVPAAAPGAAPAAAPGAAADAAAAQSEVLAFNRLLRPPGKRNLPPAQDGIHDPTNDGTLRLQPPLEAFAALPRSASGNQVDWVKALREKRVAPRADRVDPKAEMTVMDLNIVREVKGSMPDVVFPHKQHTEWLDCANCHPAIFVPQKGANQISMAAILLGQKCGVCHGKVAFPVSECRMCHQRKKADAQTAAAGKP
jgi:c(7)-type cytochrome triheme protein